ncbi:MAG: STN domain-containing protein [Pirellulales bacterium]
MQLKLPELVSKPLRAPRAVCAGLLAWALAASCQWHPAAAATPDFATGAELQQRLAAPLDVAWTNAPLIRALENLSSSQHLAIVLDRRLDPEQPLTLELSGTSLAEGLAKIAEQTHAGYCQFGAVAYLGPVESAARLRTLAALRLEEAKSLPADRKRELLRLRTSRWDELAEPKQLAEALGQEAGVKIEGLEQIPHDLWRAADLPQLSWIDRLTLLAAQFDLAFRVDPAGAQVQLVPIPKRVSIARNYRLPKQAATSVRQWAQAVPQARLTVAGGELRVDGSLEDHEFVEHKLRGSPTKRTVTTPGKELYQLSVENAALRQVMDQLAERLKLDVQWDQAAIEAAGVAQDQLISVSVKDATLDALLDAVFAGTRLEYRRQDRAVQVRPAP